MTRALLAATILILTAALWLRRAYQAPPPKAAAAPGCPALAGVAQRPVLNVQGEVPLPSTRSDLDAAGIDALSRVPRLPGTVHRGLTRVDRKIESAVHLSELGAPDGRACVAVTAVIVKVRYERLEIFVDKDLPESGCDFREVQAHELDHYRTITLAHERIKSELAHALAAEPALPSGARPRLVESGELGQSRVKELALGRVKAALAMIDAESQARDARIDSPESHALMEGRCKD